MLTDIWTLGRCFFVPSYGLPSFSSPMGWCNDKLLCKSHFVPGFYSLGICHMFTEI